MKQQNQATLAALQQNAVANQQLLAALQENVTKLQVAQDIKYVVRTHAEDKCFYF